MTIPNITTKKSAISKNCTMVIILWDKSKWRTLVLISRLLDFTYAKIKHWPRIAKAARRVNKLTSEP